MIKANMKPDLPDDVRWAAVKARDPSFDNTFYFSVATTGVYCKPSCPSRRALRQNVSFHTTCADAEAAGFRPCKRCKPDASPNVDAQAQKIAEACNLIQTSETMPDLVALATAVGLSPFHFHRVFKSQTGVTPKGYADAVRRKRVQKALATEPSVTSALFTSGFNSSQGFYANVPQILGMKPSVYRDGGRLQSITYSIGTCSLGSILVAESAMGVCAILLGDGAPALIKELADRFPKAALSKGDRKSESKLAAVIKFVETPKIGLALPLDIRGTVFQHKVWQALQRVPAGQTVSYSDIAEKIGKPEAVRAVAGACAANPLAVAIPCHRVVRRDGGLSGYRWGIARKKALLEREKKR